MLICASRVGGYRVLVGLYAVGMFFLTLPPIEPPNWVVAAAILIDVAAYLVNHYTGGKVQGWAAGLAEGFTGAVRRRRRR